MGILAFLFGMKTSEKKQSEQHIVQKAIDWRQSHAHIWLLCKFLHPQKLNYIMQYNYLENKLGELPHLAVDRFISEGLFVPASLSGKLSAEYNAAAIKDLLRQRGLPVSGTKEQGIARLLKADLEGMALLASHLELYECSPEAREIASRFVEEKEALRQFAEQSSMEQLKKKDFSGAMGTVASFEAKQVSPRGLNVDWNNYVSSPDAAVLYAIFEHRPKILEVIVDAEWEPLSLAAAMMHLWGTNRASKWLPSWLRWCL